MTNREAAVLLESARCPAGVRRLLERAEGLDVSLKLDHESLLERPALGFASADPDPLDALRRSLEGRLVEARLDLEYPDRLLRLKGRERRELRAPWGPPRLAALGHPELRKTLEDVHRLHPLRAMRLEGEEASFRFALPVPWPFFIRLDLSRPFTPSAARLCGALGDRAVSEFSLSSGRMEASVL